MDELIVTVLFYILVFLYIYWLSSQPFDCQYTEDPCEYAEWTEGTMECVAVFQEQCPIHCTEED